MQRYVVPFGLGVLAGLRSMTACAALTWAASDNRTRGRFIPGGSSARAIATAAALAEMAGDKMPFAPDRRIPPSFALRLVIGAVGGSALAGRRASPETAALMGAVGAVAGTLLGRAARGPDSRTTPGRAWGLAEDAAAIGIAAVLIRSAERQDS